MSGMQNCMALQIVMLRIDIIYEFGKIDTYPAFRTYPGIVLFDI